MKNYDFIAIGDTVTDAFIRLQDASVHCDVRKNDCQICMKFASKIPYEETYVVPAVGNSANAAVAASRLGLKSALVSNLGDDYWGEQCLDVFKKEKVNTEFIKINKKKQTNYHYVLWYEDDRTILINHQNYGYRLPKEIVTSSRSATLRGTSRNDDDDNTWLYLSSVGGSSSSIKFHKKLEKFLDKYPNFKLAFQPGTYQIKMGRKKLAGIYKRSEIFFCNREEAGVILGARRSTDIKDLLRGICKLGPKVAVITDGKKGAYVFYDNQMLAMPIYPNSKKVCERTGAGDSFSSTFTSALALGKTVPEALRWAPINAMSVTQKVGAREGLLPRKKLEKLLKEAPRKYKVKKIIKS